MGKIVERRKKKGRPSLLDLQKRTLKEQEQQHQQQKRNHDSARHSTPNHTTLPAASPIPLRRSTRRNPKTHDDDEEDEELSGKRREKKLNLVLRLPTKKSSLNSGASPDSYSSDSNAEEENESNAASNSIKKRKINAIGNESGFLDRVKVSNFSLLCLNKKTKRVLRPKPPNWLFNLDNFSFYSVD